MRAKILMVLVDNGSALNVCPFKISLKISPNTDTCVPSPLIVKAYDNGSMRVLRTFKVACKICTINLNMEFHLMDIGPIYNLLLGRA